MLNNLDENESKKIRKDLKLQLRTIFQKMNPSISSIDTKKTIHILFYPILSVLGIKQPK